MLTPLQKSISDEIETFASSGEFWCISPETGQYIHDLILKIGCRSGVECGSGIGYSSLWIASALKKNKGKLIGFEFYPPKAIRANEFLKKARLGSCAEIICASATKGLQHIPRGVDFVFLDARKCDYLTHLKLLEKKMKRGCIIVADNVKSHAQELGEYLMYVRSKYHSEFQNIGTGLEISHF